MPEKIEYKGDKIMEKYSYIIIGVIVLIFRLFSKSLKKKKEAEMELLTKLKKQQEQQTQQQMQEPEPVQAKKEENIFSTDFLEDFNKHFEEEKEEEDDYIPKNITNEQKYKTFKIEDIIQKDTEKEEEFEEQIENYNIDNKSIVKPKNITKNNVIINLKQAMIYKTILDRKY